jgi:hypothetical protein
VYRCGHGIEAQWTGHVLHILPGLQLPSSGVMKNQQESVRVWPWSYSSVESTSTSQRCHDSSVTIERVLPCRTRHWRQCALHSFGGHFCPSFTHTLLIQASALGMQPPHSTMRPACTCALSSFGGRLCFLCGLLFLRLLLRLRRGRRFQFTKASKVPHLVEAVAAALDMIMQNSSGIGRH